METTKYFESHAHYDDKAYNNDRDSILSGLPRLGVGVVINSGARIDSSKKGVKLAQKYPFVYAAVGVHPHDAKTLNNDNFRELSAMLDLNKVVAVGEIGLDYHYDYSPRDTQKYWFKEQIKLACAKKLPIIVHSREAHEDTLDIIKKHAANKVTGVIHCFSGSAESAEEYVKMGFYIGIGGVVTYKNAKKMVEVVEKTPLSKILIETDCPYLSPEPNRGKRNDSSNLKYIADKIAEIKNVPVEEIMKETFNNGLTLFNIKVGHDD